MANPLSDRIPPATFKNFITELAATALRARQITLRTVDIGELDRLTEQIALVGLLEREKRAAARRTTSQHVDLGLRLGGLVARR